MHRSSESIGTIAAALAKAQTELTNPEKSLVATIRSPFRVEDRSFRYAPLSSGLDIVRKGLGRHEIATIQTTAIDQDAGLLRLTTVLAHSSGEWISSEWPVCTIAEIASTQRMGAALTYARRYALFTLVGIAGEDDLDAPDLDAGPKPAMELPRSHPRNQSSGQAGVAERSASASGKPLPARLVLGPEQSVILRQRLLEELVAISSADEAAVWAQRNLPAKNTLAAIDAKIVEERFQVRLSTISDGQAPDGTTPACTSSGPAPDGPPHAVPDKSLVSAGRADAETSQKASTAQVRKRFRSGVIRALGKTVRLRDKEHRKFVLQQPCLVCGRVPSDPHHLTFTQPRALGYRVSDEFTVPVCRIHHRELHRSGDEAAWWQKLNIDPLPVALRLWQHTRLNGDELVPSDGSTPSKAAQKLDMSVQDRAGTNDDERADVERAVSKDADPSRSCR
jgi:hypothetical protein